MSEPFISEIRMFACQYAPRDWAFCDGALLPIGDNAALYSLIGLNYGGDGRVTVGLPNLMGRVPIGAGSGPGLLFSWDLGEAGGIDQIALNEDNLPVHTHLMQAENSQAEQAEPDTNSFLAINNKETGPLPLRKTPQYAPVSASSPAQPMGLTSISNTGASDTHDNMQPFNVLNFCIALAGIYPSRS